MGREYLALRSLQRDLRESSRGGGSSVHSQTSGCEHVLQPSYYRLFFLDLLGGC